MTRYRSELANSHKSSGDSPLIRCPVCNVSLNSKNLKNHLKKVHCDSAPSKLSNERSGLKSQSASSDSHEWTRKKKFMELQQKNQMGKVKATSLGLSDKMSDIVGKVKVNKKYYKCWQCGKLLTKASTANHLVKKHGVRPKDPKTAYFWYFDEVIKVQYRDKVTSTRAKEIDKKNGIDWEKEIQKLAKVRLENAKHALVKCPVCAASINAKNVRKHFNKVHKDILGNKGYTQQKITDTAAVTRKSKALDIRSEYDYSEDVFDRAKVYSGGAYGLGKSRKH